MLRMVAVLALLFAISTAVPAEDDDSDLQAIIDAVNDALEYERTGSSLPWSNHETGNNGSVTVTSTFFRSDGTPCRTYTRTNRNVLIMGIGCRTTIGFWQIDESGALPGENAPW